MEVLLCISDYHPVVGVRRLCVVINKVVLVRVRVKSRNLIWTTPTSTAQMPPLISRSHGDVVVFGVVVGWLFQPYE